MTKVTPFLLKRLNLSIFETALAILIILSIGFGVFLLLNPDMVNSFFIQTFAIDLASMGWIYGIIHPILCFVPAILVGLVGYAIIYIGDKIKGGKTKGKQVGFTWYNLKNKEMRHKILGNIWFYIGVISAITYFYTLYISIIYNYELILWILVIIGMSVFFVILFAFLFSLKFTNATISSKNAPLLTRNDLIFAIEILLTISGIVLILFSISFFILLFLGVGLILFGLYRTLRRLYTRIFLDSFLSRWANLGLNLVEVGIVLLVIALIYLISGVISVLLYSILVIGVIIIVAGVLVVAFKR